jgi:nucleoside-diphosphate-sugar epimerase
MARGRVRVFPASLSATLDLVPIDYVAEGIVTVAERMEQAEGGTFHIVGATPTPAAELARAVGRVAHFPDPMIVEPDRFDPAALDPPQRRVLEPMLATFGGYFQRARRFDDARFRALTGLACPPTGEEWMARLIAYGIARGYLPAAPSGCPGNDPPAARARPAPTECPP